MFRYSRKETDMFGYSRYEKEAEAKDNAIKLKMFSHIENIFSGDIQDPIKAQWENWRTRFHAELFIELGALGKVPNIKTGHESTILKQQTLPFPYGINPTIHTQELLEECVTTGSYHGSTYTTSASSIAGFIVEMVEKYGLTLNDIVEMGSKRRFQHNYEDGPRIRSIVRAKVVSDGPETRLGLGTSKLEMIIDCIKTLYPTTVLEHINKQVNSGYTTEDGVRDLIIDIVYALFANRKNEQQRTVITHTRDSIITDLMEGSFTQNVTMFFNAAIVNCAEEGERYMMKWNRERSTDYATAPVVMDDVIEYTLKLVDRHINEM